MRQQLQHLVLAISLLVLVAFVLFVINQTAQAVALATSLSPAFGQAVLVALLLAYAVLILYPVALVVRLPRSLRPPASTDSPEYSAYLAKLRRRLERNPNLAGYVAPSPDDAAWVECALRFLDQKAAGIIKSSASAVFLSTAVSQSGRLDAFVVLSAQSRMVWQVAHVYNQRPTLSEMARLYSNVAVAAFASAQIEDLDVGEQLQTILVPVIGGSLAGATPGLSVVAGFLVDALTQGAANAFTTLRVGVIARTYCSCTVAVNKSAAGRSASREAAGMLGVIARTCGAVVSQAVWAATRRAAGEAVSRPAQATRAAVGRASDGLTQAAGWATRGVSGTVRGARQVVGRRKGEGTGEEGDVGR